MKYLLTLLLLFSGVAAAEPGGRGFELFVGGGLGLGVMTLSTGSTSSMFVHRDMVAEAGLTLPWGHNSGLQLSAELGQMTGNNTLTSQVYMETGTVNYYAAKGGLYFGMLTVGGGYRSNQATIRSTAVPAGYTESTYEGRGPMAFASLTVPFEKRLRGVLEAQYVGGRLDGTGSTSGTANLSYFSAHLRVFFVF